MCAVFSLISLIVGYALCYITVKLPVSAIKEDDDEVLVKRSKPSLRSPMKTHRVHYDKYKTRDTGLYSPVTARDKKDDVEIGR